MKKQNGLVVSTDLGIAVSKYPGALLYHPVPRGIDVFNLVAHVMDAPGRVLGQERGNRRILAERLEQQPELFTSVFVPGGDPFFERHGLLYHSVDELDRFVGELAGIQPLLAELDNLPVLDRLTRDPQARALYLFPTKALSQDQKDELAQWNNALPASMQVPVATYDGDTPSAARPKVRREARIIISNPDMLHMGVLPYHAKWAEYFANLQYIVIDEMHTYRGVFGSHVANVLRRLKRITRFYGTSPQFILTSATIANPIELAKWLTEEKVRLIDEDGAPRGPKHFLIYNPPIVDEQLGIRHSVLQESVRLADDLLTYNIQTILFGRTRRTVEVMLNYLREKADDPEEVRGYRSGYLPRQRREIESGLRSGKVRAVVATPALELGIDIGGMDAAVLAGYPGTISGTWQQTGRAGRTRDISLAALVTSANLWATIYCANLMAVCASISETLSTSLMSNTMLMRLPNGDRGAPGPHISTIPEFCPPDPKLGS